MLLRCSETPRVLIAKPGLDGHDRGAKVVARALKEAGMAVTYTGIRQTPDMIAKAALREDVHAVGLSIMSGAHLDMCARVMRALKEHGLHEVLLFLGGVIPHEDFPALHECGVTRVFGSGSALSEIVQFVDRALSPRLMQQSHSKYGDLFHLSKDPA